MNQASIIVRVQVVLATSKTDRILFAILSQLNVLLIRKLQKVSKLF